MNVAEFLQDAIVELKDVDESTLIPALTFEELELDSLDYVEIQLRIKKKFKVEITPELFASGQLKNLGDLYAYIETNQPQAAVA
ncbi:phosphopantetheine-binding protein [Telluria mixta]|uniref:Phosphopantetheine-binding protein n=1 Tax=Telluria mixta TaxID=34071 RepID=A0ABT2C850_9BURK|nr:phosphopantetheine-binding protein [Telluria mixta]MCS0633583.1 phosphopantetheine-binding protein [Telluria mixta]WEM95951.1 phosphopantetheine-binding protein [Telluria mixta]